DDLDRETVDRLHTEGFSPSALVETSPGNFQAWLKHSQPLEGRLATLAARILADRFDADPSAAGWMRYGRLPGLTIESPATCARTESTHSGCCAVPAPSRFHLPRCSTWRSRNIRSS